MLGEEFVDGVPGTEYLVDVKHTETDQKKASDDSDIILIPQPTECVGRDPLTWARWKKYLHLFLLALYACAFSFGENTLGAAWTTISEETHVTISKLNGGGALNYLLLGFVNIFWIPAAMKLGRRFVLLLTTLICLGSGIWTGRFTGVAQWFLSSILNGLGTSAYQAVIQLAVFDLFFVHERGRMISVYLFGQQLGSIIGLISGGKIADSVGWRWSQYLVAIIDAVVLVLLYFLFEDTLFPRFLFSKKTSNDGTITAVFEGKEAGVIEVTENPVTPADSFSSLVAAFPKRTYKQVLKLWEYYPQDPITYWHYFKRPFFLWLFPNIVIAGFIFACGCTAGIVSFNTISEILSDDPYNFSSTATGLMCFGGFIGNIIGWMTGVFSDYVMLYLARRNNGIKEPEMRLYALIPCFVYASVGYMMYGWGAQEGDHWIVLAIGLCLMIAHQVSACGIATSYAMESFRGISGELVVVLAMCSSMINFAFSYSVQPFINATGYGFAFLFYGLVVLTSMIMAIPLVIYGKRWRRKCAPKYYQFLEETGRA